MLSNNFTVWPLCLLHGSALLHQDGRVVKALDLSSNGHVSTWVQTPLLVKKSTYSEWTNDLKVVNKGDTLGERKPDSIVGVLNRYASVSCGEIKTGWLWCERR